MQLQLSTWPEVEAYLRESRGIIVPIGSTEQHGPSGLIGTDAICPQLIAAGVGEQTGALVAPTIAVGMSQHHLEFPGSMTLRPSTLIAVVVDTVASLARHGFERFYFLNGHGGNIATVNAAFAEVHASGALGGTPGSGLRMRIANWYLTPAVRALSGELYADAEGSHATPSEVALSYFAHPDQVRNVALQPRRAPAGGFHDAADFRRRYPDGRIGSDPSLATVEHGERLYRAALADVSDDYRAFLAAA